MKKLLIAAILAAMPTISFAASLQHYQSGFRTIDGNQLNLMVDTVNNITGNGTPQAGSFTTLSSTGDTTLANGKLTVAASNGVTAITGATSITTTSALGLAVGRNGATTPALRIDASTSSSVTGLKITSAAAAGGIALAAISSGTDESLTLDAKGAGTITLNGTGSGAVTIGVATNITGNTGITGTGTITSANAAALSVGRLGATTPAFLVDASTGTSITGIKIKSAGTGGGVAVSAIGEASNGALTIDAQGSGTITLGGTSTGNIVLGRAATGVSASMTAGYTALSGTAVPASAGALAAGAPITMFSGGNKIWITSDAPSFSATKGDLCINTGGSSSSTRLYINNGTTSWIAITTAS